MKKSLMIAAGSLVLLALVLGVLQRNTRALYGGVFALDPSGKDKVGSLVIFQGADTLRLFKLGTRWVTADDSFPVDAGRMQNALATLFSLQGKEKASASGDSARLAGFGFGALESKFVGWTLSTGDAENIELGGAADDEYLSTYWKRPGKPEVYRTPGHFHGITPRSADWKDRRVFPDFLYEHVQSVETDWRDSTGKLRHYKLERISDTAVRMVEPDTLPVPRRAAAAIYVQTPQFAVDDFVAPGDPNVARAGLDSPVVVVRITMKDGTRHEIKAGRAFDGYHYLRHPEHGRMIKIFQWRFDFFKKTVEGLLNPPPEPSDTPMDSLLWGPDTGAPADDHGH